MNEKPKTFEQRKRETLEELKACPAKKDNGKTCGWCQSNIDQALTELDAIYREEMLGKLPKEIEISLDICGAKVTIAEAYGFNACLKEVKERIAIGAKETKQQKPRTA